MQSGEDSVIEGACVRGAQDGAKGSNEVDKGACLNIGGNAARSVVCFGAPCPSVVPGCIPL